MNRSCRSTLRPQRSGRLERRFKTPYRPTVALRAEFVKENFETIGLQSAAGSLAMKGSSPPRMRSCQACQARARSSCEVNKAEWAFSPYETVNSISRDTAAIRTLDRVTAGSSGGTARLLRRASSRSV